MIGLMNIPEDAPTEFFAVRPQKPQQTPSTALARPPKPLICRTSMDTREGGLIMMTHSTREQKQEEVDEEEVCFIF
jgi:hypothetical protein